MKDVTLTYAGQVAEDGHITLPRKMRHEIAQHFAGKPIEVKVTRRRRRRSSPQNRYWWGVVIEHLRAILAEFDPTAPLTKEDVNDWAKQKWLPSILEERPVVRTPQGEEALRWTTTTLTTSQMMDLITLAQQWALEWANVIIPDPEGWGEEEIRL